MNTYTIELCKERGEKPAGRAPAGGEVVGKDLGLLEGRIGTHNALVSPEELLAGQAVHPTLTSCRLALGFPSFKFRVVKFTDSGR